MQMTVQRTDDFEVTGKGDAPQWNKAAWHVLPCVNGNATYATRTKVLYSKTGLYFLTDSEDRTLTCTITKDNENIFTEDVIEVFLWPDESQRLYFEYEVSPLNIELPILVANNGNGRFHGWLPWHYNSGGRAVRHATSVRGGPKASMASVQGWMAEFFFPYSLFSGMGNVPPLPGSSWRGNIYRIDYDTGSACQWAWCPDTGPNFHDYLKFGTMTFAAD